MDGRGGDRAIARAKGAARSMAKMPRDVHRAPCAAKRRARRAYQRKPGGGGEAEVEIEGFVKAR